MNTPELAGFLLFIYTPTSLMQVAKPGTLGKKQSRITHSLQAVRRKTDFLHVRLRNIMGKRNEVNDFTGIVTVLRQSTKASNAWPVTLTKERIEPSFRSSKAVDFLQNIFLTMKWWFRAQRFHKQLRDLDIPFLLMIRQLGTQCCQAVLQHPHLGITNEKVWKVFQFIFALKGRMSCPVFMKALLSLLWLFLMIFYFWLV